MSESLQHNTESNHWGSTSHVTYPALQRLLGNVEDEYHTHKLWMAMHRCYRAFVQQTNYPSYDFEQIQDQKRWELSELIAKLDEYGDFDGVEYGSLVHSVETNKINHILDSDESGGDNSLMSWYTSEPRTHITVEKSSEHDPENMTRSALMRQAKELVASGQLRREEVGLIDKSWTVFSDLYSDYFRQKRVPCQNLSQAVAYERWCAGGIEVSDSELNSFHAITTDSLVRSIESGSIHALLPHKQASINALAKLLSAHTNQTVSATEMAPEHIEETITDIHDHYDFMVEAAKASVHQEFRGKYLSGPYKTMFGEIQKSSLEELQALHPNLTSDAFHARDYRSHETKQLLNSLSVAYQVDAIAQQRLNGFETVSKTTLDEDMMATLPLGVLDRPAATGQFEAQACAVAGFRMIYQGITGQFIPEEETRRLFKNLYQAHFVDDREYLKTLETEAFQDEYGVDIQTALFGGMSLGALSRYVRRMRRDQPDARIFTVANLRTKSAARSLAQHRVVLLGADREDIHLIDPNDITRKKMAKAVFFDRWSSTQNSGYIVSAQPR